jgi:hypothetical protein
MPMTHLTDDTFNAYIDRALTPAALAEAEAHLATCVSCATQLNTLRVVFASIEALPEVPLSRDLSAAVIASIKPARTPSTRPVINPVMRVALVFQFLLALVALAIAVPFVAQITAALPALSSFNLANTGLQWLTSTYQTFTTSFRPETLIPTTDLTSLFTQIPTLQLSTAIIVLSLTAVTILWFVGNGLLLRSASRTQRG